MLLSEITDSKKDMHIEYTTDSIKSTVTVRDREINFEAIKTDYDENRWSVYFDEDGSLEATGSGGEFEVFAYAKTFVAKVIASAKPTSLKFEVDDGSSSRESLYEKLLKRFSVGSDYVLDKETNKHGTVIYTLTRK